MTKGIYTHKGTAIEYELLDDRVINKQTDSYMALYCEVGKPTQWYVRTLDDFQHKFIFKREKK